MSHEGVPEVEIVLPDGDSDYGSSEEARKARPSVMSTVNGMVKTASNKSGLTFPPTASTNIPFASTGSEIGKRSLSFAYVSALATAAVAAASSVSMLIVMEIFMARLASVARDDQEAKVSSIVLAARGSGIIVSLITVVAGALVGRVLGLTLTRPVASLVRSLGGVADLQRTSNLITERWQRQERPFITEIDELQSAVYKTSRNIATFSRFLPDAVVRSIMGDDERAHRLNVSRRIVTVMFSDIKNFTTISETLQPADLMFLLTRYFSIMTRIVACYDGVVVEILGDGLLVVWNAWDNDEHHAAKACAAAVAKQQVLKALNAELDELETNLPHIAIRIGLHTGRVFCGNIGSESRMKFGCIGDPVNVASRLEGLNKHYGTNIICSGETQRAVPSGVGLVYRELDVVNVKGKKQSTQIFDLIGMADGKDNLAEHVAEANANIADLRQHILKVAASVFQDSVTAVDNCKDLVNNPLAKQTLQRSQASSLPSALPYRRPSLEVCQALPPKWFEFVSLAQRGLAARYEEALLSFQGGRSSEAARLLEALLEETPDDVAARLLLQRAKEQANCWV